MLVCRYLNQNFVRVHYFVRVEYSDPALNDVPPKVAEVDKVLFINLWGIISFLYIYFVYLLRQLQRTIIGALWILDLGRLMDIQVSNKIMGGAPLSPQRPGPTQNFETL